MADTKGNIGNITRYHMNNCKLKGIDKTQGDMTKLSEWKTMSETRETFVTSKKLVGVGALQITSHAMSQIGEVELTGTYRDFDGTLRRVVIKLPNSNTNKLDLTINSGKVLVLLTEAPTSSFIQWSTAIYESFGSVKKMISTGHHTPDVWKSVLFQLVYGMAVLQEKGLYMKNFSIENI